MATALFWLHLVQGRAGDPQHPPPLLVLSTPAQLYWHHPFCSRLTSVLADIFSVIYTKKRNIRDPLAKISWKIIGCFTVLCTVFICLNRFACRSLNPEKPLKWGGTRAALWKKWDFFISARAGGKVLGSTYRREIILLREKKKVFTINEIWKIQMYGLSFFAFSVLLQQPTFVSRSIIHDPAH